MAYRQRLIAAGLAALFAYTPSAWAFYANTTTPAGFTGSAGNWLYQAKRTDSIIHGIVRQASATSINVGGRSVAMTAAYRYGALAGRVAATLVVGSPYLLLGAAAIGIAYWVASAKVRYNQTTNTWEQEIEGGAGCTVAPCYEYRLSTYQADSGWVGSKSAACSGFVAELSPLQPAGFYNVGWLEGDACRIKLLQSPGGSEVQSYLLTPSSRSATPLPPGAGYEPITPQQAIDKIAAQPMPDTVPQELPEPSPLPVEQPVTNPSPGDNPQPQPMRVPTSDPVPTANPGEWRQPYTDVVPSPSPSTPWRVDVKPGDVIQTTPTPMPEPVPLPLPDPLDPNAPPVPGTPRTEEQLDLCQKYPQSAMCQPPVEAPPVKDPIDLCLEHPEIVACQTLGDPFTPEQVANEDKQITLTPDAGWGTAGACPPPRSVTLAGGFTFQLPYDMLCDFARMIRPLIVGMAYVGAAIMLVGAARKE